MGELKVVPNPRLSQSLPLIFTCDDSKDAKSPKDVLWGYKKLTMTFNPCLGPPNVNFWRKSGLFDRKPLTMGTLISKLPFTGSAVALHCCKAHERINRKTGNSTPCKIVTPEKLSSKVCTRDYVMDGNYCAIFL